MKLLPGAGTPREQAPPGTDTPPPEQATPLGAGTPWEQTPPGADTPPREQAPPPPQQTATVADGTHRTGMYSCHRQIIIPICFNLFLVQKPIKVEKEEPSTVLKDEHRKHKHKHKDSSREKSRHKKKKVYFLMISYVQILHVL